MQNRDRCQQCRASHRSQNRSSCIPERGRRRISRGRRSEGPGREGPGNRMTVSWERRISGEHRTDRRISPGDRIHRRTVSWEHRIFPHDRIRRTVSGGHRRISPGDRIHRRTVSWERRISPDDRIHRKTVSWERKISLHDRIHRKMDERGHRRMGVRRMGGPVSDITEWRQLRRQ